MAKMWNSLASLFDALAKLVNVAAEKIKQELENEDAS